MFATTQSGFPQPKITSRQLPRSFGIFDF